MDKPLHLANISDEIWKASVIPKEKQGVFEQCQRYMWNFSMYHESDFDGISDGLNHTEVPVGDCDSWVYDRSQYESTIVTEV